MGKTHTETLNTITNIGMVFMEGTLEFTKAEEIFTLALDGYKKALG